MAGPSWLDRTLLSVAPGLQLRRERARAIAKVLQRHYEGAAGGRRTQNWYSATTDPNAANELSLAKLRDRARDLVRNNGHAESALTTIADHAVGYGILAKPVPASPELMKLWQAWAETTACDAEGRCDFYGLQKLVMRGVAESGEMLVRRRMRRPEDGLPIPMQLEVLEPDYLDTSRSMTLKTGKIVQGVEFDAIGRRVAYWLYPSHPGSSLHSSATLLSPSRRIPATEVLHVYKARRAGQVRAATWFSPVLLRFKDFDEFEDATLVKQKVAAMLTVLTTDVNGDASPLGTADDKKSPGIDSLEVGAVLNLPPGRDVKVVEPPSATDYEPFTAVSLRAIAAGLGVAYEDLTGDYTRMPFSAARMSRLRHWARVHDWRWQMLIPQFCGPVWMWAMETAAVMTGTRTIPQVRWTPPPMPMIEPDKEGLAAQRNVRTGIQSLPEAIRERGYDPDELVEEIAAFNKKLDSLGIVLDSDPRKMTQAGQAQGSTSAQSAAATPDDEDRLAELLEAIGPERAFELFQKLYAS